MHWLAPRPARLRLVRFTSVLLLTLALLRGY